MLKQKVTLIFLLSLVHNILLAHCQVPCGVYDDAMRIIKINEDFETIKKSMIKINDLSNKSDSLSRNQLIRWVNTKDRHASNIQKIVTDYFLTQRVKESNANYIKQVTTLHQLLIISMKCKQTVDTENVKLGLNLIQLFVKIYFDTHGIEHLNKISK